MHSAGCVDRGVWVGSLQTPTLYQSCGGCVALDGDLPSNFGIDLVEKERTKSKAWEINYFRFLFVLGFDLFFLSWQDVHKVWYFASFLWNFRQPRDKSSSNSNKKLLVLYFSVPFSLPPLGSDLSHFDLIVANGMRWSVVNLEVAWHRKHFEFLDFQRRVWSAT